MSVSTARIRLFAPGDYENWVAASNRTYPEYPWTVEEMRHGDETFDSSRFFKLRMVAEEDGAIVGSVETGHRAGRFHPDRYAFDVWVVPERRRRGHGAALHDAAVKALRERSALAASGATKESMADGVAFLLKRGWKEQKRDWESRLRVSDFDLAKFAAADERIAREGIRITTYADELARDPAGAPQRAYELIEPLRVDVPSTDPATPVTFEEWRKHWIDAPGFLPEAFFVAVDQAGRWVGMSNLQESIEDKSFIWQGLTGVLREARGKGIAMALKLRTVRHAQTLGVDHIKTWNDQKNRPMLSINEAMGFEKQPAWISFELAI
ncbi:MAG: GNAT family N-acetyltransferase [Chloroflexota bacterium]